MIKLERETAAGIDHESNKGYYYFRPDFAAYQADTLNYPGRVGLKVISKPGLPATAVRPGMWAIFLQFERIRWRDSHRFHHLYKDLMIYYEEGKLRVRPRIVLAGSSLESRIFINSPYRRKLSRL